MNRVDGLNRNGFSAGLLGDRVAAGSERRFSALHKPTTIGGTG
jgi:hypothetical protein